MRAKILAAAAAVTVALSPAVGQEQPAYLDDRSTAEAVISSYYNAIARGEYTRAFGYFHIDTEQNYDDWRAGYADTASVALSFGETIGDGAAGSTYYSVPVALDVTRTDGVHAFYSGCYVLRLVQPLLQEIPPFQGIHIESADLSETPEPSPPPASCE